MTDGIELAEQEQELPEEIAEKKKERYVKDRIYDRHDGDCGYQGCAFGTHHRQACGQGHGKSA